MDLKPDKSNSYEGFDLIEGEEDLIYSDNFNEDGDIALVLQDKIEGFELTECEHKKITTFQFIIRVADKIKGITLSCLRANIFMIFLRQTKFLLRISAPYC